MTHLKIMTLANEGRISDAMELVASKLSDIPPTQVSEIASLKGETFAIKRAREFLWIATAHAKQGDWKEAQSLAKLSLAIYQFPNDDMFAMIAHSLAFKERFVEDLTKRHNIDEASAESQILETLLSFLKQDMESALDAAQTQVLRQLGIG